MVGVEIVNLSTSPNNKSSFSILETHGGSEKHFAISRSVMAEKMVFYLSPISTVLWVGS